MFSEGGALVNRHFFDENLKLLRDHTATGAVYLNPPFNSMDYA